MILRYTPITDEKYNELVDGRFIRPIGKEYIKTFEDALKFGSSKSAYKCGRLLSVLTDGAITPMTGYLIYKCKSYDYESRYYTCRSPFYMLSWIVDRLKDIDNLEQRLENLLDLCNDAIALDVRQVIKGNHISAENQKPYKIGLETFYTYMARTNLLEWILRGQFVGMELGEVPVNNIYNDTLYPKNIFVKEFSKTMIYVLGRARVMDTYSIEEISSLENVEKLRKVIHRNTHVKEELVTEALNDLKNTGLLGTKFNWSMGIVTGVRLDEIWVYSLQDSVTGGLVLASTESEAIAKVCDEHGLKVEGFKDIGEVYPISALELNKPSGVLTLW